MDGGIDTTKRWRNDQQHTSDRRFQVLKQQMHNVTEELGKGLLPAVNFGAGAADRTGSERI
ncbi:MAG: hypothetical protein ACLS61_07605 [Ruminococcus sp.]